MTNFLKVKNLEESQNKQLLLDKIIVYQNFPFDKVFKKFIFKT